MSSRQAANAAIHAADAASSAAVTATEAALNAQDAALAPTLPMREAPLQPLQVETVAPPPAAGSRVDFSTLDANSDGRLSRDEVAFSPRLTRDFDRLDTNGDGFLQPAGLAGR